MNLRHVSIFLFLAILSGCGGGGGDSGGATAPIDRDAAPQKADLYYSYPADGQKRVAPDTPLVLGFLERPDVTAADFTLTGPDGAVSLRLERVNGGKSLVLRPEQPLTIGSQYNLKAPGLVRRDGKDLFPGGALNFTTRPALDGPLALRGTADTFKVSAMSPDGKHRPFLDFSSIRLTLSQPADGDTLVYGDTVRLTQNGKLVEATLLVDGRGITIDPINTGKDRDVVSSHDLQPGVPLTIELTDGVHNLRGQPLTPFQARVTPLDSTPRALLVQRAPPATPQGTCLDQDVITSPLTGDPINCVPVMARLLGDTTVSKLKGNVYAQLANPNAFPKTTPLRIPRGSLLIGQPLQVRIGGHVDAGFDSGTVKVTFLSDALGYMMPNPYSDDPDAPRKLVLIMDVAFSTEDLRANGAFNQTLLHVKLVGTVVSDTETGRLVANAIGVVEPTVMGVEHAYGVLSFHMASYPNQSKAPERPRDMSPPELKAWMPGEHVNKQRPGDPIILSFSEPVDGRTVQAGRSLTVTAEGQTIPFQWYLDGTDLVIQPKAPLAYDTQYQVSYTNAITDLAGNGARPGDVTFTMPHYADSHPQAPLVLSAYPGYPCGTVDADLSQGDAGRCAGGKASDDHLPLAHLPAQRSIYLTFSQVIDPASVNSDTFIVERVDATGTALARVPGKLQVDGRTLRFIPKQAWQPGAYYRYTLKSRQSGAACGSDAICDVRGLPLQTRLLAQSPGEAPEATAGGPDLPIYFQAVAAAAPARDGVLQHLRNLPTADVNANFRHDSGEPVPSATAAALKNSVRIIPNPEGSGGGSAIAEANVGCPVGESCPDKQYSAITGNLNVALMGFKTAAEARKLDDGTVPDTVLQQGGVLVYIYPTRIVVANSTVYVETKGIGALAEAPPSRTGPQLLRIRYTCDPSDPEHPCAAPEYGRVKGWIVSSDDGPKFLANLHLYLDAPKLDPVVKVPLLGTYHLSHNLHSYNLTLRLAGPVTFLADGRLQIAQINQNRLTLDIKLDGLPLAQTGSLSLIIPAGGNNLNYVSAPIKD